MKIRIANDRESLEAIRAAADRLDELAEQIAIEHATVHGNRQHAVTIALSALQTSTVRCLHQMAALYGQELTNEEASHAAKALQSIINGVVTDVLGRVPHRGN